MKIVIQLTAALYIAGAVGIFALHPVSPVSLGLAAARPPARRADVERLMLALLQPLGAMIGLLAIWLMW